MILLLGIGQGDILMVNIMGNTSNIKLLGKIFGITLLVSPDRLLN
jgi:hypothetical protein